jgi:signal transduction histidine kinase/CheY-like chemotaxis protein
MLFYLSTQVPSGISRIPLKFMHRSLRTKVVLWFLFIIVAVSLAGLSGFRRLANYIREDAKKQMVSKMEHVIDVLGATDTVYMELVHSSMRVLKLLALQQGEPHVMRLAGGNNPALLFGSHQASGDNILVDQVRSIMGGTATIFGREGDDFVRVSTNVMQPDGSRAIGTRLDPKGPAIVLIRQGKPFYGVINVLGKPYITGYEPIFDTSGEVIGIYYVGYALETLATLRETMERRGVLKNGFFSLLNHDDEIVFRTQTAAAGADIRQVSRDTAQHRSVPNEWYTAVQTFQPWDYDVVAAMYLPDVNRLTLAIIWQVYGVTSLIILGVLIVSFWLAKRLSDALDQAETSRQEAIDARDAAESANRTKSTFLANMSHELRTPMNAIIGYSEMLIEEAEDLELEDLTPDLHKIRAAGKHLLALINDVLDLSKIEAGKMTVYLEDFNVAEMINEVVSTIQPLVEKNSNTLIVKVAPESGMIRADLTKVRQALFNLLSNASKFTERGSITLKVDRRATQEGERITFAVSDTGIGMTQEQLGKLFQAFTQADASTTRKYGGTGLGLIISRKFCQMMGGDILVDSTFGEGTTFTIDIPVSVVEIKIEEIAKLPVKATPGSDRQLVVVIDDDDDAGIIIRRNLEQSGYEVAVANNGPAGIKLVKERQPLAVTLDVMMPGMDGWSVLTALKSDPATSHIPVIMVTMLQDRSLGFSLGASEFLTKPVNQEKLRSVLSRFGGQSAEYTLVVEDDPSNRQLICRMLEKENIRFQEAVDGNQALEQVSREKPALILLDLMMPVMDGFQFLALLRQNPEFVNIPVVVITAKDLTPEERQRLTGSVSQIIQKGAVDRERLLRDITAKIAQSKKLK